MKLGEVYKNQDENFIAFSRANGSHNNEYLVCIEILESWLPEYKKIYGFYSLEYLISSDKKYYYHVLYGDNDMKLLTFVANSVDELLESEER